MAPVFFKKLDFLDYPVDFNKKWKGKPLLGSHKTIRGFFFGILLSIIVVYIQKLLFGSIEFFRNLSLLDYSAHNFLILGILLGFGALFGDAVESLFKRRAGIKPGKSWIPLDQLDFVIGALVFLAIVYIPPWQVIIMLLIIVPILHIAANHAGYYLGINDTKW
jgi:CDP-2,3-bis-(O-geranylgeranyl)-sn-glycerol synthase